MEDKKYLEMFLNEAYEYLEGINNCLLNIENGKDINESVEMIFRNMHTLKGMAAAMNFTNISELSHALEDVFNKIKKGEAMLDLEGYDRVYKWIDELKSRIDEVASKGKETSKKTATADHIREFLISLSKGGGSTEPSKKAAGPKLVLGEADEARLGQALKDGRQPHVFHIRISEAAPMPSVRAFQVLQKFREAGEIVTTLPEHSRLEEDDTLREFFVFIIAKEDPNSILQVISSLREIDKVTMHPFKYEVKYDTPVPVPDIAEPQGKAAATETVIEPTIKVKISHLDILVNLIGELIINTIRLEGIGMEYEIKPLKDEIVNFQRITSSLQDRILLARMVPVGQIFNKYPRIVRDLSRKLNKKINFMISGSEIELDRVILDEIDQPLIHLLRNSVDHGVESPEERKKAGKPETGTIELNAKREKNRVIIEVKDDGKGLNIEKIKSKALKMDIVTKEKLGTLGRSDILMLICKPGFSTSENVTDVSGRGVGMDVVKTKIDSLNGVLNIESDDGRGSVFSMILPMTLAIIQTLIVSIGDNKFLIPIANIQETMEMTEEKIKIVKNREVIFLRDEEVVPLIRMNEVLGLPRRTAPVFPVVFVELGEKKAGLVFDELHSKQQTVIKSLDSILKKNKIYSGKGLLSNGDPALIIDIASILE